MKKLKFRENKKLSKVKCVFMSLRIRNIKVFCGKKFETLLSKSLDSELDYLDSNLGFTMSFSFLICKIKFIIITYFIT